MKKKMALVLMCSSILTMMGCASIACGVEPENLTIGRSEAASDELPDSDGAKEEESAYGIQTLEVTEWGLTLYAEDVTPEGATIVCTQSGGSPSGELATGSYYVLERAEAGKWEALDNAQEMEVGWTAEAWIIPMEGTAEMEVDWEWLYGSLPAGHYRIGKEITDFRAAGDFDKEMYYAEFEIE